MNSPVIVGEDGAGVAMQATGFEFGVDPNEDPELALVSSILKIRTPEQFAVITLKFEQVWFTVEKCVQKAGWQTV